MSNPLDDMPPLPPVPDRYCPTCGAVPGARCVDYRINGSHPARSETSMESRLRAALDYTTSQLIGAKDFGGTSTDDHNIRTQARDYRKEFGLTNDFQTQARVKHYRCVKPNCARIYDKHLGSCFDCGSDIAKLVEGL